MSAATLFFIALVIFVASIVSFVVSVVATLLDWDFSGELILFGQAALVVGWIVYLAGAVAS